MPWQPVLLHRRHFPCFPSSCPCPIYRKKQLASTASLGRRPHVVPSWATRVQYVFMGFHGLLRCFERNRSRMEQLHPSKSSRPKRFLCLEQLRTGCGYSVVKVLGLQSAPIFEPFPYLAPTEASYLTCVGREQVRRDGAAQLPTEALGNCKTKKPTILVGN